MAVDALQLQRMRVDVAHSLPFRRELGATLACGRRLLGYHCWLSGARPFESLALPAFAGLWLACEGGLLAALAEQNKNGLRRPWFTTNESPMNDTHTWSKSV